MIIHRSPMPDVQIPDATIADAVDAFRRFRTSCDRLGVQAQRAIATSAMRDARNSERIVDRVREASGFEIDVISGTQEAYLLKLGVETRLELGEGRSVLVDVGGGVKSVEPVHRRRDVRPPDFLDRVGAQLDQPFGDRPLGFGELFKYVVGQLDPISIFPSHAQPDPRERARLQHVDQRTDPVVPPGTTFGTDPDPAQLEIRVIVDDQQLVRLERS